MKIVFTGPECTGKTTLSQLVALQYDFGWVKEMARAYIESKDNHYSFDDLDVMARMQVQEELDISKKHKSVVCDTDLMTFLIWYEEKYSLIPEDFYKLFLKQDYRFYFLMSPDKITWHQDGLRENPFDRDRLYELYLKKLEEYKLPYMILDGDFASRVERVGKWVEKNKSD